MAWWERKRPLTSATAKVISVGRMSATRMPRRSFRRRYVGRRPRGSLPVGPYTTHFSRISCSVIKETVLRCKPDTRARSAREMGCRLRMRFSTTPRLMVLAVSLEATCVFVKSIWRICASTQPLLGRRSKGDNERPVWRIFVAVAQSQTCFCVRTAISLRHELYAWGWTLSSKISPIDVNFLLPSGQL